MSAVLYIHGKGGSAAQSEHYRPLFPGCAVVGLDYQTFTPWETGKEIRAAAKALCAEHGAVTLIADSIGAFFSLYADLDHLIETAYFISPVVDMEALILALMRRANVTEAQLQQAGEIETPFGETLSWAYLQFVRTHPVSWNVPTEILYGSADTLTSFAAISAFAEKHHAALTVMDGGEHWFHTEAQMRFLDQWIKETQAQRTAPTVRIQTERLALRLATQKEMETLIASQTDPELKQAYSEMLQGCLRHPAQWEWYGVWMIELKDTTRIGDLSFKGLDENGVAELGYGISPEFQGRGYASEAVQAICEYAFQNPKVTRLEAETLADNKASQRVLEKCGFAPDGTFGEEGPRFSKRRRRYETDD